MEEEKPVTLDELKKGIELTPGHLTVLVVSAGKGQDAAGSGAATGDGAKPADGQNAAGGAEGAG